MTDDDLLRTRREVTTPVTAELDAAGFEDAVEVGRGGFSVVYRCRQPTLDRTVAVKVLTTELDADNQARFLREQQAMGRLTGHPNIVTVLEAGTTATGRPYLVMPYHPLDSLDAWIRRDGPLSVENAVAIGVKIAGALESAHHLGILHRDVKPGNILLTDYGEPALTDFGIAHVTGGFRTGPGVLTGSPAFTAPEVLEGDDPTPAADVYGLGATLFSALTGHAAFERRSGENVVAQFVRVTTEPVPDLREGGIPDDVTAVVESAMNRDPHQRPSATALGEALGRIQRRRGLSVGRTALTSGPRLENRGRKPQLPGRPAASGRGTEGNLPLELTSFIGRRTELAEVKSLLSASRLLTLTGIGGVGKTRLALRAASSVRSDFSDGVWLLELADITDPALLVDVVAMTLGVRDEMARPLLDVLLDHLCERELLLVFDNCEQVVDAVAELSEALLHSCPELRILATSREPMNIPGESVLRVSPLSVPDPAQQPTLLGMPRFDAVTLFADRATVAEPGFELDEDNKTDIAQICARLDGLPLAIELAAARIRAMSPHQILQRLDDRYALLSRGSRTAPTRQQTLRWSIDWSYDLCAQSEQRLWARLAIFTGGFELDAAEQICGVGLTPGHAIDVLASLVDKSILIREETGTVVWFRLLETLRDYGREKLRASGEYEDIRRRHRDWYLQLIANAEADWISDRQPDWIARFEREQPNLRDALEFCLSEGAPESAEAGLSLAAALFNFWNFHGMFGEGRAWLERVLALPGEPVKPAVRAKALRVGTLMASAQGDFSSAAAFVQAGRALAADDPTPATRAQIAYADGILALTRGDPARAASSFEDAVELLGSGGVEEFRVHTRLLLGWANEVGGHAAEAAEQYRQVLSITGARGELVNHSAALRGVGVAALRQGARSQARQLIEESLRLDRRLKSPTAAAFGLEALAWTIDAPADAERVAVLMGAAEGLWPLGGGVRTVFSNLSTLHEDCAERTRRTLGARRFDTALRRGRTMGVDAAVAFALGEESSGAARTQGAGPKLTKRERQVANLVSQGLSNKQIAAKLVISQRTAQSHIEHVLSKLGFTSRAQIAAWVVTEAERGNA
ncbi:protein kinase domain-containing protein [Nocardia barduliensis]|uniref:protein kinase domain-containing protein n=1 Tax=Nocardia barduliensis TaxID=2736643 RepID=UPI0015727409|nr:protein kinase [Nocardia barduliensis]